MWRSRDGDLVRDMIYQRQNFDTGSMGNRISSTMELEASGSGVGPEVQS